MTNLPAKRDSFYAAEVPATLSECVVRAGEYDQDAKGELALLRGMLAQILKGYKDCEKELDAEGRSQVIELVKEVRATLKVQSDLSAREKGLLHPSALIMCAHMVVKILQELLPDPDLCSRLQLEITNRMAQLPLKTLESK